MDNFILKLKDLSHFQVIAIVAIIYIYFQLWLIHNNTGLFLGRKLKNNLYELRTKKMFKSLAQDGILSEKDIHQAILDLQRKFYNPLIYIWISSYVKFKDLERILLLMLINYKELVKWYNSEKSSNKK